jgi:hypothetical protein
MLAGWLMRVEDRSRDVVEIFVRCRPTLPVKTIISHKLVGSPDGVKRIYATVHGAVRL